jgi:hypothetical protein
MFHYIQISEALRKNAVAIPNPEFVSLSYAKLQAGDSRVFRITEGISGPSPRTSTLESYPIANGKPGAVLSYTFALYNKGGNYVAPYAANDKFVVVSDYLREKDTTPGNNGVATLAIYDATQANVLLKAVNITVHPGIYLNAPYKIKLFNDHVVFFDSLYTKRPNVTVFDYHISSGLVTQYVTNFPSCAPYTAVPDMWDLVANWKNASDPFPVFVFAQKSNPSPLEHFCALPLSTGAGFKMPETGPLAVLASDNTYVQFHRNAFGPNMPAITFRTAGQQTAIDGGELIVYNMVTEEQRWPMNEILETPPVYNFNSFYLRLHYIAGDARIALRNGVLVYPIGNGGLFEYNLQPTGAVSKKQKKSVNNGNGVYQLVRLRRCLAPWP